MASQIREWHNNVKKCDEKLFNLLNTLRIARDESCITNNLAEVNRIEKEIDEVRNLKIDILYKIAERSD